MKHHPLILFTLFIFTTTAFSQSKSTSFYVQAGTLSAPYVKEHGGHHLHSATETDQHKCIILNAGLLTRLPGRWRAGIAFTYDHFGTKHRSVEFSNLSYMLRADRIWKEGKRFTFYSGAAAGVRKTRRFEDEKETGKYAAMAYHVYLAGAAFRFGGGFYADVNAGWGVCGVVSAGMQFRF